MSLYWVSIWFYYSIKCLLCAFFFLSFCHFVCLCPGLCQAWHSYNVVYLITFSPLLCGIISCNVSLEKKILKLRSAHLFINKKVLSPWAQCMCSSVSERQKAHSSSPYRLQSTLKKTVHRTFKETIKGLRQDLGLLFVLSCFFITCKMYHCLPHVVFIQNIMCISEFSSGFQSKFQTTQFPNLTFAAAATPIHNPRSTGMCDALQLLLKPVLLLPWHLSWWWFEWVMLVCRLTALWLHTWLNARVEWTSQ